MTQYIEHEFVIERHNLDGSISFIPKDLANSDYQAYLKRDEPQVEHLTEIVPGDE